MFRLIAASLVLLGLAGCVSEREILQQREDMLAAAGFRFLPANTPERRASLASQPPHILARHVEGDRVGYVFADPTLCNCLLVGDEAAYSRFQMMRFQQSIAAAQLSAAQMNENASMWGPWGTWGGPWGWR
ncbi:MAG TPA: hypothetical protein VMI52_00745 [Acetobacteraceae bacterium]|nr:hypothetical protein [Acetobacteraceae bacterium]